MSAAFNPLVETLSPPPVPSVFAWAKAYQGDLGPLIDLSQAVPGYAPHPQLLQWLGEAAQSTDCAGYGPIEGDPALRDAYAEDIAALYEANVTRANIHITAGCNQAFMCALMAVAGAGDTIALTDPFYFNHESTLAMLGIRHELLQLDPENSFLPDMASVNDMLSRGIKALALVSPNNPTGAVYPAALLREIFDACRDAGVWLILDETYRDFLPSGQQPHDLLSPGNWEDNLVLLYSFSKSFCIPGHRLGAVTAGPNMIAQIAKVMDNMQICAPRAPQAAVAKAISALSEWRDENRLEIFRRTEALKEAFKALPGWSMDSLGAYFAFVRHPFESLASAEVAEKLAKQVGVLAIPGAYFGARHENYLRFAFANADVQTISKLPARLSKFSI